MHEIVYKKKAIKSLTRIPAVIAAKFKAAFYSIADSQADHLDIKALEGLSGFRLRIGNYRAIYEIDNGRLIVTVFNIGSRGDIYK
jgi:mRNA interferase RelE/StbE